MNKYVIAIIFTLGVILHSCIEDNFTLSPSDQPYFSTDTLKMGDVYTLEGTPTHRFTVINPHDKALNISSIALRDDDEHMFRLNVDGISDRTFSNVEIRANDSIFVFVEATLPENGTIEQTEINRHIDFVTNGVTSTVVFNIVGQDAMRIDKLNISNDTIFEPGLPYLIADTIHVEAGATLTLKPGVKLRFREKAAMKVSGTLISEGTSEQQIEMIGHRDGYVAGSIPYEIMSGQWGGIYFTPTSRGNRIAYTSIRNSNDGLTFDAPSEDVDEPILRMYNSQVRNTTNYIIDAYHSNLELVGCELADASNGILRLIGGTHVINHCTIANYYLFTVLGAASIDLYHLNAENCEVDEEENPINRPYLTADFTNCIVYGNGTLISHGDLTNTAVTIRRCLLGVAGEDDDNFISCLWDQDPLYYTERLEYHFDYRLKPKSPAIGASFTEYDIYGLTTDRYGVAHTSPADLGAYVYVAPEEEPSE